MKKSSFKPAWWLPSAHMQTLWQTVCRRSIKNLPLRRERFELPDGDFVDLDWAGEGNGPIVLVLHGLEGSIESPYASGMLKALTHHGWRAVLMHFRGCSGESNRHFRSYHSGETVDIATVISAIRSREQNTLLAAVGFSLGGNVLLKWLGECGQYSPLAAAVAISVPFELQKTSDRIQQGFSKIYQYHFLVSLRKKINEKIHNKKIQLPLPSLKDLKTIRDFDHHVTAPLHGFMSAEDYYTRSSSRQFLHKIAVPTLLIQAKDDPFMTRDLIPHPYELSPCVTLELSEKGGHVGFVSGNLPWRPEYWLEQRVPEFLAPYLLSPLKNQQHNINPHSENKEPA